LAGNIVLTLVVIVTAGKREFEAFYGKFLEYEKVAVFREPL
jgi:hypothetical protein